ncbi:MAG: hypothetical protein M3381_04965 [Actinomycetota bacterium]|nr:hypothetical protein [Actinomycetota bacterium]
MPTTLADGPERRRWSALASTGSDFSCRAARGGATLSAGAPRPDLSPMMAGYRRHDVHGAAAHGLATIGVSWGCSEPDELLTAGAVATVDTPEKLGDVLLRAD